MACDTFLKIVQKCRRKFVILQVTYAILHISAWLLFRFIFVYQLKILWWPDDIYPSSCSDVSTQQNTRYEIVSLKFVDIDHQNRLEKQSHLCANYWKDCQQPSWIWRPIRSTHSMKLYHFCLNLFFLSLFTALVIPILPLGTGNNLGLCYYIRWASWFKQKVTHKGAMSTCKSWWNCQIRLEFFSPKSFANLYYVGFWAGFVTVNDCSIAEMGRNNWSGSPECWIFKGPRSCESSFKHTTGMDGICTVSN